MNLISNNTKVEYPRVLLAGHSILDAELTVIQLTPHVFSFEIIAYDIELKAMVEAHKGVSFTELLAELKDKYIAKVLEIKKAQIAHGKREH